MPLTREFKDTVKARAERAVTLETGSADRRGNMDAFARRALELVLEVLAVNRGIAAGESCLLSLP
jgi:hypothetical protein